MSCIIFSGPTMHPYTADHIWKVIKNELYKPGPVRFGYMDQVKAFLSEYKPSRVTPDITRLIERYLNYVVYRGKDIGSTAWDCQYLRAIHTRYCGSTPQHYRTDWSHDTLPVITLLQDTIPSLPSIPNSDRLYGYIMCLIQFIGTQGVPEVTAQELMTLCHQITFDVSVLKKYPDPETLTTLERVFYTYMKKVCIDDNKIESHVNRRIQERVSE